MQKYDIIVLAALILATVPTLWYMAWLKLYTSRPFCWLREWRRIKRANQTGEVWLTYERLVICYNEAPANWMLDKIDEGEIWYLPTLKPDNRRRIYMRLKDIKRFKAWQREVAEQRRVAAQVALAEDTIRLLKY